MALTRSPAVPARTSPAEQYELVVRSQGGAEEFLEALGALREIEAAVMQHCRETAPTPTYQPQRIKELLKPQGWIPEVRVPPYDATQDELLTINERYDLFKIFEVGGTRVGVALEMNDWRVQGDLLKLRRGLARKQIRAGVILQPDYSTTHYTFEHVRHLNEPLFGELPIVYCSPRGAGLKEPSEGKKIKYKPYLFP